MLFLIVSQKAEFGHFGAQLAEQIDHAVAVDAACKIQIKKVLEILSLCGARLDFCEVEPQRIKAAEQVIQRALNVRKREAKADFIGVARNVKLLRDHYEPRGVVGVVLQARVKDFKAVFLCRLGSAYCRHVKALFTRRVTSRHCSVSLWNSRKVVLCYVPLALRERLRVRPDYFNVA